MLIKYLAPVAFLFLFWTGCDEVESTLGGVPGGDAVLGQDSLSLTRMTEYSRSQQMWSASIQTIGRMDSLNLESTLVFRMDYTPMDSWDPQPDSVWVDFSFKMSNDTLMYWFPQDGDPPVENPAGSRNVVDLELYLLDMEADSLGYDEVSWDELYADASDELLSGFIDSLSFRVNDDDVAYGGDDADDPLEGRRTYRRLPVEWFSDAETDQRFMMMRVTNGQQGMIPVLASGWNSVLRPGLWFHEIHIDTLIENDIMVVDTLRDSSYVACSWQSSAIRDTGSEGFLSISSGWAGQVMLELEPLHETIDTGESIVELDELVTSFSEATLVLPLGPEGYNQEDALLNVYTLSSYDSAGVDLESWQLVGSTAVSADSTEARINMINHLRHIWTGSDSFVTEDPIVLALKLDDYSLLRLRKLNLRGLEDLIDQPRLVYTVSGAPEEWRP